MAHETYREVGILVWFNLSKVLAKIAVSLMFKRCANPDLDSRFSRNKFDSLKFSTIKTIKNY